MSADFSTRPRDPAGSRLALLLVVAGAVLLAGSVAHAVRAVAAREAAQQERDRARREVEAETARLRAREGAGGSGTILQRQAELTAGAAPPRVIADLAPLLPPGARVKQLVLDYGNRLELDLRVEARTPADYDRLLEALGGAARFESVLPGSESREGVIDSSVRAVYRPRGAR
jgi:hypothetical protein